MRGPAAFTVAQGRVLLRTPRNVSMSRHTIPKAKVEEEDSVTAMEDMVKRKSTKAERAARRAAKEGKKPFTVEAPVRDAVAGGDLTAAQIVEGRFISVLFVLFCVCLTEGIVIAASGFLPDAVDQFIQDYVYTAFSPSVGLFLLCSTAYGLWKTRNDSESGNTKKL